eukprot:scaffold860_cov155-Ochromonas_danica.AAC.9
MPNVGHATLEFDQEVFQAKAIAVVEHSQLFPNPLGVGVERAHRIEKVQSSLQRIAEPFAILFGIVLMTPAIWQQRPRIIGEINLRHGLKHFDKLHWKCLQLIAAGKES